MRSSAAAAVLLLAAVSSFAQAPKPCEELKAEIAKKLEANGVKSYSLEIVTRDKDVDGKVVGSCEAGTRKIVYHRTSTPPAAPAAPAKP